MKFPLKELFNTKYLYITFNIDLHNCFQNVLDVMKDKNTECRVANARLVPILDMVRKGAAVEFDLADCYITPDCASVIQKYANEGLVFVDSSNHWRDKILKENRHRREIANIDIVELPKYDYDTITLEYVKALDTKLNYCLPAIDDGGIYLRLAYIITVVRPEINIVLGNNDKKFMEFVGKRLGYNDIRDYNEFYFATDDGVEIVDFNGPVYNQRMNSEISKDVALTLGYLVPTVLGKQNLIKVECFRRLFEDCLNVLESFRVTKKRRLQDVL